MKYREAGMGAVILNPTGIVGPFMVLMHTGLKFQGLAGLATALAVGTTGCGYNAIQTLDENANRAKQQIAVQLQRRADLVPNLVETVKGAADFEKETFTAVTEADGVEWGAELLADRGVKVYTVGFGTKEGAAVLSFQRRTEACQSIGMESWGYRVETAASGDADMEEGCLSVPDFQAEVNRAARVKVRALDLEGQERHYEADGLRAVCFQHEIDHLNGVLILDRVSLLKRFVRSCTTPRLSV